MTLIDTSVWVEFFRRNGNRESKVRVAEYLEAGEAAFTCPVYFEILSGAFPRELPDIHEAFSISERIIFTPEMWDAAATLERALRQKGISVPRDDIFVATASMQSDLPLCCRDKHFELIRSAANRLKIEQLV